MPNQLWGAGDIGLPKLKKLKIKKKEKETLPCFEQMLLQFKKFISLNKLSHILKYAYGPDDLYMVGDTSMKIKDLVYASDIYLPRNSDRFYIDCVTGGYIRREYAKKVITDVKTLKQGYTEHSDNLPVTEHPNIGLIIATSVDNLIENGYQECYADGVFYNDGKNSIRELTAPIGHYNKFKNQVQPWLQYCDSQAQIKYGTKSNSHLLTDGLTYTFGCELEFSTLFIPNYLRSKYNWECMRDGSLNKHVPNNVGGPEIVTGIFTGDAGFSHLQDICLEVSKRSTIDYQCGVHIHIGNFKRNNDFILLAYLLGTKVQKEFLELVPKSRWGNEYCKSLKNLKWIFPKGESPVALKMRMNEYFEELFRYLSHGYELGRHYNTTVQHPLGPKTNYNHETARYCWLNLIPTAFNTREDESYTLEFRHMQGSSNFTKIMNWTRICMAFVHFVENAGERILYDSKITIKDIVEFAYPKSGKEIMSYVDNCKKKFASKETAEAEEAEYIDKTTERKKIKEIICV